MSPRNSKRPAPQGRRTPDRKRQVMINNDVSNEPSGRSLLRLTLDDAIEKEGGSLADYTVLATRNDPFRVDTPAMHRDGGWLAITAEELGLGHRTIHLRGLHYMVIGRRKPNGLPYTNTEADWTWLSEVAGKAARWLGFIPFEQIVDNRNAPPRIRTFSRSYPSPYLNVGIDIDIPDEDHLVPRVGVSGFTGEQPFKIVFFGEKSSLFEILEPIARQYEADLYLPTGEISDTLMHHMATVAVDDGRPMAVLCLADCDPAGHQMSVSIARKLQAFRALGYQFEFELYRVALTADQVHEYGLPSTPLKETERRADRWRDAMGVEQTEIDALASLRPQLLRQIVDVAVEPFFDSTLARRVTDARERWQGEAQAMVDAVMNSERLVRIRSEAAEKLIAMRAQIETMNDALQIDVSDLELPDIVVPDPELTTSNQLLPLVDSRWSFTDQCKALRDSKAYVQ